MKLTVVSAVAAIALTMTPALAKSKKHQHRQHSYQTQQYSGWNGGGWNNRNVSSDPSIGNRGAVNNAYRAGRCVEDLGYGRYEYCGW